MTGFRKATKEQAFARVCLDGPSGAGKTWTGLVTATALADGGTVAVIDSERGSASLYADLFDFDVMEIDGSYDPTKYVRAIRDAQAAGYQALLIDSLTHAWSGQGGVLDQVDAAKSRFGGNTQRAWAVGTPLWQGLIDAILQTNLHVVCTIRSKTRWVEEDDGRGKKGYRRAGTEPVARDGIEFEFQIVGDMDLDHTMVISKTRAGHHLEAMYRTPGPEFGRAVLAWLRDGVEARPDPKVRARELMGVAGDDARLADALRAAGIARGDLADDMKWGEAMALAREIADTPPTATVESESGDASGAPGVDAPWEMSDGQRRKLWATINASGWSDDGARAVVASVTGDRSTSSITSRAMYDDVLVLLEAGPSPVEGEPELWDEPTIGDRETPL